MDENLIISLRLLVIGMTTVVTILLLVVLSSKLLIRVINKLHKEVLDSIDSGKIKPEIVAAVQSVVSIVTNDTGQVDSIQKK